LLGESLRASFLVLSSLKFDSRLGLYVDQFRFDWGAVQLDTTVSAHMH